MGIYDQIQAWFSDGRLKVSSEYELLREAVTGTMSTFHMARHKKTGEVVGLKLLDAEKTAVFEDRFKGLDKPSEGEIALQLSHPRIVETFDHGITTDGRPYIVSEFLEGPVLSSLILSKSELLFGKRAGLVRQMSEAVAAVHDAGFIHRDICPRNFICAPGAHSLKLIDFGLTVPRTKFFMEPGNRTGTPSYLAPEIVRRRLTDHRVDIFALGVSAYYLCTYQLPWPGQDVTGKAALRHDTEPPVDIFDIEPLLNQRLGSLIMKCLAVDPDDRPHTAKVLSSALADVEHEID